MRTTKKRQGKAFGSARTRVGTWLRAAAAFALPLALIMPVAPIASAAVDDEVGAVFDITKTITNPNPGEPPVYGPGDVVVFELALSCSVLNDDLCLDAAVHDTLPSPLQLTDLPDFPGPVQVVGGAGLLPSHYTVTADAATGQVDVSFSQRYMPGGPTGLLPMSFSVRIAAKVPDDATFDMAGIITNEATTTATNTLPDASSAALEIAVPETLASSVQKQRTNPTSDEPLPAVPGRVAEFSISGSNTSNRSVDTLVFEDPRDGATDPFEYLDLTGFGELTTPAGADGVRLDWRDAGGVWHTGTPVAIPDDANDLLFGIADLTSVHGIRLTFSSTTGSIASGATGGVVFQTVTNDKVVDLDDNQTITVTNTVASYVTVDARVSEPVDANANVQIHREKPSVTVSKEFDRSSLTPGESTTALLTADNGPMPVTTMVIAEPGKAGLTLDKQGLTFDGFVAADISWPGGATAVSIQYQYASGLSEAARTSLTVDTLPAPKADEEVIGFVIIFTGAIDSNAQAEIPFTVTAQAVPGQDNVTSTNTVDAQVFDAEGQESDIAKGEDDLTRTPLRVTATLGKSIVKDEVWATPGSSTLVQLPATVNNEGDNASTVGSTSLVISDPANPGADEFWEHFDLTEITSTAIPANSKLTVTYWNGTEWTNLPDGAGVDVAGPVAGWSYTPSAVLREQIGGIRFTYEPLNADELLQPGFSVLPFYRVAVRASERTSAEPIKPGTPLTIDNVASAEVQNPNATPQSHRVEADDSIVLVPVDGDGGPGQTIDKGWILPDGSVSDDAALITALTEEQRTARLTWGTRDFPFEQVVITDPSTDPANVAASVYDAFNLVSIQPITAATDPAMTFDKVSKVELFSSATNGWVDITGSVCGGGGADCDGVFPGYSLTAAEQASTLAVRLTFVESPTRADRITGPNDPQVGTGIAGTPIIRPIDLVFQQRLHLRSNPDQPVLGTSHDYTYNTGTRGTVRNTVSLDGTSGDATYRSTEDADITIIDVPLNVQLTKQFDQDNLPVPPAETDQSLYPVTTATLVGTNATASKVFGLSVSDPSPAQAAPTIYETLNLYKIAEISVPSGATSSVVTLTRGTDETEYTIAQARGLTSAQLSDVTAFRVDHTGPIAAGATTRIALDYQLRKTKRSDGSPIGHDSGGDNIARATVESPGGANGDITFIDADDDVRYVEPTYSIETSKSFQFTTRTEAQSPANQLRLRAQPGGTVRTTVLSMTDDTPTFWNAYNFTSFPSHTLPSPVRQIRIDALVGVEYALNAANELIATCNGSETLDACWVEGNWQQANTNGSVTPQLPAGVSGADVRGVRASYRVNPQESNWEKPFNPVVPLNINVTRRDTLRYGTGGATNTPVPNTQPNAVPAPGETTAGTTSNDVNTHGKGAWRKVGNPALDPLWSADDEDDATTVLTHLPNRIRIEKGPVGDRQPSSGVPWSITVTNTGQRPISDLTISDTLNSGADVREADREPGDDTPIYVFTLTNGGSSKSTEGFAGRFENGEIKITVPDGFVFAVGDVLNITADFVFRTGLEPNTIVANSVSVSGDRWFDQCVGVEKTLPNQSQPITKNNVADCTASTQVRVGAESPMKVEKWVRGDGAGVLGTVPGDANYNDLGIYALNASTDYCQAPDLVDGVVEWWRTPCLPITRPGGVEQWRLAFTNLGNINANVVAGIDVLPAYGDRGVIIDAARSSRWDVTFLGETEVFSGVYQPETVQYLYLDAAPQTTCNRADILNSTTPGGIPTTDPCFANVSSRDWKPITAETTEAELATARALKFVLTYADGEGVQPGETVGMRYKTRTAWQAPVAEAQDVDPIAWNSVAVGTLGAFGNQQRVSAVVEPRKVGVMMATGKLDLSKKVVVPEGFKVNTPSSYDLVLTCASGPEEVRLTDVAGTADMSKVTLAADGRVLHYNDGASPSTSNWSHVNLPLYADCELTEPEAPPGVVVTTDPTEAVAAMRDFAGKPVVNPAWPTAADVPTIEVTNTFHNGGFVVSKEITTNSPVDQGGNPIVYTDTYTFSASCIYLDQEAIPTADRTFTLEPGDSKQFNQLPAGADCTVTETANGGAARTTIVVSEDGTAGTAATGSSTSFTLLPDVTTDVARTHAAFTNVYDVSSLTVTKALTGAGAAAWGDANFTLRLVCTMTNTNPATVYDATHVVSAANPTWTVSKLPAGANCTVTEPQTGGANSTVVVPASLQLAAGENNAVTVTNTFNVGSVAVTKALAGDPAASLAPATTASYEVNLVCERVVNGQTVPVTIPGGATRTIVGAGTVTYTGLPTGASCTVTETEQGHASSSAVTPEKITVGNNTTAAVTVTNTFDNGALTVIKTVSGAGKDFAPATFNANVVCTWHGANVPLANGGAITVAPGAPATVSNIPVGSDCVVTEGDNGQSSAVITPAVVTVSAAAATPAQVTIANTYDLASLQVEKHVLPQDASTPTGFEFTAVCEFLGNEVLNESFTLNDGETREFTGLPARSSCVVTETDDRGATSTVTEVTVDEPTVAPSVDTDAREATIPELTADAAAGEPRNSVSYTNLYDINGFEIVKSLRGGGADAVPTATSFTVDVQCVYAGETVVDQTLTLAADTGYRASLTDLPAGAECTVTEDQLQGADAVTYDPAGPDGGAVVTIPEEGEEQLVTATVSNWYLTGQIEITKSFAGAGAEKWGTGQFELSLQCTSDGEPVEIEGGATRTVTATEPVASYTGLPSGAACALTETDAAGATSSRFINAAGGTVDGTFTVTLDPTDLTDDDQQLPALGVENTFDFASVTVSKTVETDAVDDTDTPIAFGPFEVELVCTWQGEAATAAEAAKQTIANGESFTWTELPTGADCTVTETDTRGAASTTMTVSQHGATGDETTTTVATLTDLGSDPAELPNTVDIINVFPVSSVAVTKSVVTMPGAIAGTEFEANVVCTLVDSTHPAPGLVVRDVTGFIGGPSNAVLNVDNLPVGSDCVVTETNTGAADITEVTVAGEKETSDTVTVELESAAPVGVAFTNTYTTGSLTVHKTLVGDPGASLDAATTDTYTVLLSCTLDVDGESVDVPVTDAERTITGAGSVTYTDLPTQAECAITETDAGHATSSSVNPESVTIGNQTDVEVTVTNTFDNGALLLTKIVSGPGAEFAPTAFGATVTCDWYGSEVPLAADGRVTLVPGELTRVADIPIGSDCSVVEDDHFQTSSTVTPEIVTITPDLEAPAQIDVENVYELAGLRVAKEVLPTDVAIQTGFGFEAVCTFLGEEVLNEQFTLDAGEFRDFTGLPSRASCEITETDPRGASSTTVEVVVEDATVAPETDNTERFVSIPELSPNASDDTTPQNTATYTNLYELGGIEIVKNLRGGAASQVDPDLVFDVEVQCTYVGDVVADETMHLSADNGYAQSIAGLPEGSACTFTEPDSGGADAVSYTPAAGEGGEVTVKKDAVEQGLVENWFHSGSLEVTKLIAGDGADAWGAGPFTVNLACTLDGESIDVAGGAKRTVSAANPTASYTALPTGAECTLTEPDAGGAGSTRIVDADGETIGTDSATFTVVTDAASRSDDDQPQPAMNIVNTFELASVELTKVVHTNAIGADGKPVVYGPFGVELACTWRGEAVSATEPAQREVAAGETIEWTGLPAGADCSVTETDAKGAEGTTTTVTQRGSAQPPVAGVTALLTDLSADSAAEPNSVVIENPFEVTSLTVAKRVTVAAGVTAPTRFTAEVVCTLSDESHPDGLVVRDVSGRIGGDNDEMLIVENLPVGSECVITETETGKADKTEVTVGGETTTSTTTTVVLDTTDPAAVLFTNTFLHDLPGTGASTKLVLPLGVGGLGLIGLGILLASRRRRDDEPVAVD